ncbi:MAG TPA: flippase [Candidatus Polarisedimenticolia bacterium]|nr:flippase [Candidatus Polarisedimenticolia bacterium]
MPEIKDMKDMPSREDSASSKAATLPQTAEMAETPSNPNGHKGHDGENEHKGHNGHLTSGRLLARNTVWNLLGNGAPMLVAIFCIPILIRRLGTDRFGVLTLAWALIGYANLFDLGLGRALTQLVAQKLGAGKEREIPSLVWTSLLLMTLLGFAGTACVFLISPWLVHSALNVPDALEPEMLQAFRLLALSIPFVITTAGLRGLLEAHQRFGLINALRVPLGVFTFAGPLLVLPFSKSLVAVVGTLVAGRIVVWAVHLSFCLRVMPALRHGIALQHAAVRPLLRFGGWITVANIVNPILVSMDRFLIGAALPVAMVGYYTAPFEAVTKLWMIPSSLTATVFPACSTLGTERKKELEMLYSRSIKYLFLVLAPISLVLFLFAGQITRFWLGHDFAEKSTVVLQILSVGVFINCFAHVPYCFLQALGRPDTTAKLFVIELAPYAVFAWLMIRQGGIVGAATAWSIRVVVEVFLLILMAWRTFSLSPRLMLGRGTLRGLAALSTLGLALLGTKMALQNSLQIVICLTGLWLVVFALAIWKYVFDDADRKSILTLIDPLRNAVKAGVPRNHV